MSPLDLSLPLDKEKCDSCERGDCVWHDELIASARETLLECAGGFSLEEMLLTEAVLEELK